jgi:hypothetical protein
MKNILIILFLFLIAIVKAQTISDYKYIVIPTEFNDFKENKNYGLSKLLEKSLTAKKYTILPETKSDWPSDALMNPCSILNAELLDDKSMFRNKIILQFKDCSNKIIFLEKGGSMIKEFEPGFQDALKQTLVKIPSSNPKIQTITKTEANNIQEQSKTTNTNSVETKMAQKFSNGKLNLQKIQIDRNQFILVDGNSSVPFATFKVTTKQDVFRVKLSSGESTIGYFENGNIIIEIPKANGDYSKENFVVN